MSALRPIYPWLETRFPGLSPRAWRLKKVREESKVLQSLRSELFSRWGGGRCLIVGSAPGISLPDMSRIDAVICMNGSGITARHLGIPDPDLTVMTGVLTVPKGKQMRIETIEMLGGLKTGHLLLHRARGGSLDRALDIVRSAGYTYDNCTMLSDSEYAAIATAVVPPMHVLTKGMGRISTGIFATTVALWAGARDIVLAGFSLSGGHSYLHGDTPRNHKSADAAFFSDAVQRRMPIETTSDELHSTFGVPFAR